MSQEPYVAPELYDIIYSAYRVDVPHYVRAAREARGPVLEVACGTGRVLIPCLEAGADADGLDLHEAMLDHLRRKIAGKPWRPNLVCADMRDFTMPRRYALITIPFRAFMHIVATDDQIQTLRCIRDHLEPGGVLRFNVFHPHLATLADPRAAQVNDDKEVTHPETGLPVVLRVAEITADRVHQILRVAREVVIADERGYIATTQRHAFTLRWTYKAEMELLLRAAGFTRFEVHGGFDGEPLERDEQEMVWTAWKD